MLRIIYTIIKKEQSEEWGLVHKKEYLLKFSKDRNQFVKYLFKAKKKFGLVILNYMVTSNHIHLLVYDLTDKNVIPESIKFLAGRMAQDYNNRKNRYGPTLSPQSIIPTSTQTNLHRTTCHKQACICSPHNTIFVLTYPLNIS